MSFMQHLNWGLGQMSSDEKTENINMSKLLDN